MKCFILLAIILAISVHITVSQNTGTSRGNATNPNVNDTAEIEDSGNEEDENSEPQPGEGIPESNSNDTSDTTNNNSTTMTNAEEVQNVISGLSSTCQGRYTVCYGPDSTESDIRNKVISDADDDEVCELIEDGEDCVTTVLGNNVCTDDEYEEVRVQACSACRSAVLSVVLVGFLSLISKILSHH